MQPLIAFDTLRTSVALTERIMEYVSGRSWRCYDCDHLHVLKHSFSVHIRPSSLPSHYLVHPVKMSLQGAELLGKPLHCRRSARGLAFLYGKGSPPVRAACGWPGGALLSAALPAAQAPSQSPAHTGRAAGNLQVGAVCFCGATILQAHRHITVAVLENCSNTGTSTACVNYSRARHDLCGSA